MSDTELERIITANDYPPEVNSYQQNLVKNLYKVNKPEAFKKLRNLIVVSKDKTLL